MSRLTLPFLLAALLFGQVTAQPSVVFAQAQTQTPSRTPALASIDRALEGLVSVSTTQARGTQQGSRGWSPFPNTLLPWLGTGTGIVISDDEILTSYRLVQGHDRVTVKLRGGQSHPANVVGTQPQHDLALLKVENLPKSLVRPVTLGNSDSLRSGQKLIALGLTPEGGFSAQEVTFSRAPAGNNELSLDTSLNAQARGGPLVNAQGEVVALSTGRFGVRLNEPFALGTSGAAMPVNTVKSLLADLRAGKQGQAEQRPRLGVRFVDLRNFSASDLRNLSLPTEGLLVQDVEAGSPAAKAGLRGGSQVRRLENTELRLGGDVIVAVDGQKVQDAQTLQRAVQDKATGATLKLEIWREGKTQQVSVTLDGQSS
ncbi:S1C family serine protease [Deinococcus peraridilitoris]|uniref:Trypsin-like serine protease with C-terminal PDZ domain protein n=1 Tax=Deinococcus peraridilitoris (strain DSM 19664 / LMG 22246 / CIP 109416 / KR-200) TaxID=937777 RepID=L0A5X9_DEIPD|nr:trypsin-like peptidase domain-containing protein [Deinococcus peraridilitoris]AFZ68425.1 trypsin-like serine protease with C-terminal PDZ domain protein [Deinococcus peraridilitoris DSM 19664]